MQIRVRCACGRDCSFGAELSGQSARCYGCGAELKVPVVEAPAAAPAPRCPACGGINKPDARDCRWCGKPLAAAAVSRPAPAAPSAVAEALKRVNASGRDSGVPWEDRDGNFLSTWWRTWWGAQFGGDRFWGRMPWSGGYGPPLRYALMVPLQLLALVVALGAPALVLNLASVRDRTVQGVGLALGCGLSIGYAVSMVLGTALGGFFWGGVFHLLARLLGGRGSYEASYRGVAYLQGTVLWWLVPILGPLLQAGAFVLGLTTALARAHELPKSRALVAALLPVLLCLGATGAAWLLVIAAGN